MNTKHLIKHISFYQDAFYRIEPSNEQFVQAKLSNKLVCVVSKQHCFECRKEYPIDSISEARKAAMLAEGLCPFPAKRFLHIEKLADNRTSVTFIFVKQSVYDLIAQNHWLVIPEPLLLVRASAFYRQENLTLNRIEGAVSLIKLGPDYRMSVQNGLVQNEISMASWLAQLPLAILLEDIPRSFNQQRVIGYFKTFPIKRFSLLTSAVFLGYMTLASLWLLYQQNQLEAQLSSQKNELGQVFEMQRVLESKQNNVARWADEPAIQRLSSDNWFVIAELMERGVEILSFGYNQGTTKVRGRADKATEIIAYLSESDIIDNVQTVSPIVKSRRKEVFSVTFEVKQ